MSDQSMVHYLYPVVEPENVGGLNLGGSPRIALLSDKAAASLSRPQERQGQLKAEECPPKKSMVDDECHCYSPTLALPKKRPDLVDD